MDEFKDQIKDLYKAFSDNQKNTKGTPHKFDSHANFRGKLGVNDTGIALTPKAYKNSKEAELVIDIRYTYRTSMRGAGRKQWIVMASQI